jgi:hypothetical protein
MEYGLTGKREKSLLDAEKGGGKQRGGSIIGKQKWTMEKGGRNEGRKEEAKGSEWPSGCPNGESKSHKSASQSAGWQLLCCHPLHHSFPPLLLLPPSFISLFPSSSLHLSHPLLFSLRLSIAKPGGDEGWKRRREDGGGTRMSRWIWTWRDTGPSKQWN